MMRRTLLFVLGTMLWAPTFERAAAQPPEVSGYQINWFDEFNGTALDQSKWTAVFSTDPTNNSLHAYLPENILVNNGNMVIVSTNQPFGQLDFRSGLAISNTEHRYGRFEVRADLPTSRGMWPAIWLNPDQPPLWPSQGEIDIMENRGNEPHVTSSAFHWGTNPPFSHFFLTAENETLHGGELVNYHDSFHVYAVEWDPEQIRYYVDNVHYFTIRNSQVGNFLTQSQTNPMRLLINTAVGGFFLPNPDGSTQWPQFFEIDYVYVYDRVGDPVLAFENGAFDDNGGTLSAWSLFGNAALNVNGSTQNALSAPGSLKVHGQFGSSPNFSGVEQGISVKPGDNLRATLSALVDSADSISGSNNDATLKIDFYNKLYGEFGLSDFVGSEEIRIADGNTPNDQWFSHELLATVPAGAVEARLAIVFKQSGQSPGAVFVDNVEFQNLSSSQTVNAVNASVLRGTVSAGTLGDLNESDDARLEVLAAAPIENDPAPVRINFDAISSFDSPSALSFRMEASANTVGLRQTIEALSFTTGQFEQLDASTSTLDDSIFIGSYQGDLSQFIRSTDKRMIIRVTWQAVEPTLLFPWKVRIDDVSWTIDQ